MIPAGIFFKIKAFEKSTIFQRPLCEWCGEIVL